MKTQRYSTSNLKMLLGSAHTYANQHYNKNSFHSIEDSYQKALTALSSLQSNEQVLSNAVLFQHAEYKRNEVVNFFSKCDLNVNHIAKKLSVIHVSGTKGKGSTCAYCEAILRKYGYKTGFYSSPYLVSVRETIRINGQPISRQRFAEYFWDIYGKLRNHDNYKNIPDMPSYFTFLTIMAFKIFVEEKVDVAIVEVGIGGEYDCTNVLPNTAVVGISSLGYDHVQLLGNTIEEIAWQKAGIMKPNCVAITVCDQPPGAMNILHQKAVERKCTLFIAPNLEKYFRTNNIRLGVNSPAQFLNASLGLQLANAWLNPQHYSNFHIVNHAPVFPLPQEFCLGLQNCSWPGRTQILPYLDKVVFYLDGAHNPESMRNCVEWFRHQLPNRSKKALVFNMTGNKDGKLLLKYLIQCQFDYAYFCPNIIDREENSYAESFRRGKEAEEEQYKRSERYYLKWLEITQVKHDGTNVKLFANVRETFEHLENNTEDEQLHVLVTGSLHLVGAFLSILKPELRQ